MKLASLNISHPLCTCVVGALKFFSTQYSFHFDVFWQSLEVVCHGYAPLMAIVFAIHTTQELDCRVVIEWSWKEFKDDISIIFLEKKIYSMCIHFVIVNVSNSNWTLE